MTAFNLSKSVSLDVTFEAADEVTIILWVGAFNNCYRI